ncbi:hypothetical protein QLS71_006280 [Mariniflexile litorale]|uniref:Uncharacterized protein n=1 Tax=Mariniflexile litorale TaxID=3045158 RepID=A0AAU7EL04_9FLAO|nr:hypothetical protein [Mariniflexile sp. KMM 9835]MDQ8211184.1 hypothetical protein [Mariniflexile sp. KMM 9835]
MESFILNIFAIIGVFVGGYQLFLFLAKNSEERKRTDDDVWELINNCNECRIYASYYDVSLDEIRNIQGFKKHRIELLKIINEPANRKEALESISEKKQIKLNQIKDFENKRKIGYKYENEIFEIFDTYYKLTQDEIIDGFMKKFSTNQTKATEIFQECYNNWLITKVNTRIPTDEVFYEVGFILDSDGYKLTQNDLTRKEWLKKNNKVLDHRINLANDLPF